MENASMAIECPQCGSRAVLSETEHEVMHFGPVLISALSCSKCGFRLTDVMCVNQTGKAKAYSVRIEREEDLETKIIRSSTGTVKIPELETTIEPGPGAEGYISNIEGLLERIEGAAEAAENASENKAQKKASDEAKRKIRLAKNAEIPFTVILEDPFGNSALAGAKVKELKLSEEDIKRMKQSIKWMEG